MSDGLKAIYKLSATIERLEAELASWQRHGVKVTEDCETCDGAKGFKNMLVDGAWVEWGDCPDCGGTGKQLRDGAERDKFDDTGPVIIFPAEWLEAE